MNNAYQFKAVVCSRFQHGEELFWGEIWTTAMPGGVHAVFAASPTENFQAVLHEVLDWSRRQGKELVWDYQLAKESTMKHLISSGAGSMVGPQIDQGAGISAPNSTGSAVLRPAKGETSLSRQESSDLFDCEKTIREGLDTFVEVGQALAKIRDSRLYRYGFANFEQYVRERWGMSGRHAHRLVDGADIAQNLLPAPAAPEEQVTNWSAPTSESQVRPLKGLKPEEQREVWETALKSAPGGILTAKQVDEAREKLHPKVTEIEVLFSRVDTGGDIDSTNCHNLLAGSRGKEPPQLKKVFGHAGDLWVVSLGHHGGSPGSSVVTQEAHRLILAMDWSSGDATGFAEGRRVFWKGRRMRLGPTVIFKGVEGHDQDRLEETERGGERVTRTYQVDMDRAADGDMAKANSAGMLSEGKAPYKIRPPFEFDGRLWCVSGSVFGRRADGVVTHDGHELIPVADYAGPEQRPFHYEGALVTWKGKRYQLGPLVVFRAEEKNREFELQAEEAKPAGTPLEKIRLTVDQIIKEAVGLLRTLLDQDEGLTTQRFHLASAINNLKNFRGILDHKLDPGRQAAETRRQANEAARKQAARKANARSACAKGVSVSIPAEGYVVCRTNRDGKKTFQTMFGGWTNRPNKAKTYPGLEAAKKGTHHSYDKPVKLSAALRAGQ